MIRVEAHALHLPDPAAEETFVARRLASAAARVRKRPANTGPLFHEALRLLGLRAFLRHDPVSLAEALHLARDLGTGLFLRGGVSGSEQVTFQIGAQGVDVQGGATIYDTAPRWLDAWSVCRILRDDAALARLCDYDPANFEGAESYDAYHVGLVRALRALQRGGRDLPALLAATRAAAANAHVLPERAAMLWAPAITLLERVHARDAAGLDELVATALRGHREVQRRPDAVHRPESYLPLFPLSLVAWAHDLHLPVTVASDYLPEPLVRGTWAL